MNKWEPKANAVADERWFVSKNANGSWVKANFSTSFLMKFQQNVTNVAKKIGQMRGSKTEREKEREIEKDSERQKLQLKLPSEGQHNRTGRQNERERQREREGERERGLGWCTQARCRQSAFKLIIICALMERQQKQNESQKQSAPSWSWRWAGRSVIKKWQMADNWHKVRQSTLMERWNVKTQLNIIKILSISARVRACYETEVEQQLYFHVLGQHKNAIKFQNTLAVSYFSKLQSKVKQHLHL